MILPEKHIPIHASLFGFGAYLLGYIEKPLYVEDLWDIYRKDYREKRYPVNFTFDEFIMTLDYLYIIKGIDLDERGRLTYASC